MIPKPRAIFTGNDILIAGEATLDPLIISISSTTNHKQIENQNVVIRVLTRLIAVRLAEDLKLSR
jgi:hypothetical protein